MPVKENTVRKQLSYQNISILAPFMFEQMLKPSNAFVMEIIMILHMNTVTNPGPLFKFYVQHILMFQAFV